MPQGQPDYGYGLSAVTQTSTDSNSIIASLAGLAPLDGLGRVVYFDDFRSGLGGWLTSKGLSGEYPVLDWTASKVGTPPLAVKMNPVSNTGVSALQRQNYFKISDGTGVDIAAVCSRYSGLIEVLCTAGGNDSALFEYGLRYYPFDGDVMIRVNGDYVTVGSMLTEVMSDVFYFRLKLVASLADGRYRRILIGGKEVDLSAYALDEFSGGSLGALNVSIAVAGYGATYIQPVYLDGVILTSSEPNN